ncbi:MAG TPA: DUF2059 domain-containing protein [Flavobacterium sp.]|uniref:DUF2059 domain-containing protein n=1 Tax=Flavobacterium sp. TaxID=239 RepID=UPI002F428889
MNKFSIILGFCLIFSYGFSQSSLKNENIKQLLELTGSGRIGTQVAQNIISSFKTSFPNVPEEYWDNCMKEMDADAIISLIIPIYDKYYSDEEIQQLTAFYQSEIGKKIIKTMPIIVKESMEVGKTWGMQIGEKVMNDLEEKGFVKKQENYKNNIE